MKNNNWYIQNRQYVYQRDINELTKFLNKFSNELEDFTLVKSIIESKLRVFEKTYEKYK